MRKQKTPSIFMKYLEYYVNTYMPEARGLSKNTINSYKTTFTLLIKYMYSVKNTKADEITFDCLDVNTLSDFMSWLENERKCSVTTRNQRLAALYSFSEYAQNYDFDAASTFRSAVLRIPSKKAPKKRRVGFTTDEVKILLALPDQKSETGLRDIDTIEDDKKKERIDKIDKISFENVSFRYSEKDVLKNINIEFEKNSITAIVGESGCGKSTILNILYGLWKPQSGNIYFNFWPYEKLNIKSVRNNITIVCQEPFLFNSSIIDNIKMGTEGNDQEKIDQVIKCVGLETLIEEKEEENVGEKGNNLSGGQKQRVAIARALLRDSDVIVFDEATSNLDNLSQKEIMNNISSYFKDKIVIIIAHRLSTIKSADRIIVMHKGEIVESGTEDYLLSKNGFYKKLDNTDEGEKIC